MGHPRLGYCKSLLVFCMSAAYGYLPAANLRESHPYVAHSSSCDDVLRRLIT